MIREILVTTDLPRTEVIHRAFDFDGQQNIFSARNKDFHKIRRRQISPAFGLRYLRSLEPILHECTQILVQKIDEIIENPRAVKHGKVLPNGHIDIGHLSVCFTVDTIGEMAFGKSFNMVNEGTHPVVEMIGKTMKRCLPHHFVPWILPLDFSFLDYIHDRLAERKAVGTKGRADILQHLINAQQRQRDEGIVESGDEYGDMISGKLTDKALVTECAVFLVAGVDTSATVIGNTIMFLAKNPEKLARLREELSLATASNEEGVLPLLDQIRKLPYLSACINETLRIRPIVTTEVNEDMTINGYFFPKGTILLANYPHLHWSEEHFPQPNKYIPERWIPSESPFSPVPDNVFYAFSAGARSCVGKEFAMMNLRLVIATLILLYDMERVSQECEDDILEASPGPEEGTYVLRMSRRSKKAANIMRSDSGISVTSN
ncbi:hypothetical protein BGZ58_010665 [Dissophora ornata]|nr:hypothetical protein BGZ58_010665 [Dissophora ornata]